MPYDGPDRRAAERVALSRPLPAWWPLSEAETQVAEWVAAGCAYGEIALRRDCSHLTVLAHMRHVGQKLPGQGPPQDRARAFVVRCQLWLVAHPGQPLPASLLRGKAA